MSEPNHTNAKEAELTYLRALTQAPSHRLTRALAILSLLFIVPLLVAGIWMDLKAEREIEQSELRRDLVHARTVAALVEGEFNSSKMLLVSIADRYLVREGWQARNYKELNRHLQDVLELEPAFLFASVYELDGTMRAIVPPDSVVGQNFAYRDWYRGVSAQWQPYVSEVYRTAVAPNPLVVAVAVPIHNEQGKPIGILMAAYTLEQLRRKFEALAAGASGIPCVVDQNGIVVTASEMFSVGERITGSMQPLASRALTGQEGSERVGSGETEALAGYAPLPNLRWSAIYSRPASDALAPILRLRRNGLTTAFYLLLVYLTTVGVAAVLVRHQTHLLLHNRALNEALEDRIRELKTSRENLRRAATEIEDLYNRAPCGYHSLDAQGTFVRINDTELDWIGRTREEVMGKMRFSDLLAPQSVKVFQENFPKFKERGSVANLEFQMVRKDGSTFPVMLSATAIRNEAGEFVTSRTTVFDITERKRAQEERDRFFSVSLDLFCVAGFDGYFKSLNPAWEATLGYGTEELLSRPYLEFIHPEDRESTAEAARQQVEEGKIILEFENRYRSKDGSYRWLSWRSLPVPDAKLIHATARDVTERKQAEEALRRAKEEAERTSRFKDQFLSTMSHELRTPLNAVLGFSELLEDERYGPLNERQRRYLNHIQNGGRHLLTLINDILDLSKIEAGRVEMFIGDVPLRQIFHEVLAGLRPLADKKSHVLSAPDDTSLVVRADPTRLRQVLTNLLANAVKFTPAGGRIELSARAENGAARIEVRDNGPGIPVEEQRRIFEAFHRLRNSGQSAEGTGLGLAITQRLVELQGGQLSVESQPGQGSCFYFTVPVAAPARADERHAVTPAGTGPRILVVENDALAAELIRSQLLPHGYEVEICVDPQSVLERAAAMQPHAITLDVLMEPLNGFEVLLQLKSDPRTMAIPVIVLTVVEQPNVGFTLGADEYLIKPVEKSVLVAAVRRCLKKGGVAAPQRPILVVEDDAPMREAISDMLVASGFPVAPVTDGAAAREWVRNSLPEVVILDLLLPEVSGFELLAEWRSASRTADLPVFVLTAKDLTREEEQYLRDQAEYLLRKHQPWQQTLLQQLRRIATSNRAKEQA
jgi:PAS domain S-box-containing protein